MGCPSGLPIWDPIDAPGQIHMGPKWSNPLGTQKVAHLGPIRYPYGHVGRVHNTDTQTYLFIHSCAHAHIKTLLHMLTHAHIYLYTCTLTQTLLSSLLHIHICTNTHICTHEHLHAHTHTLVTCVHIHENTYIYTQIHTHL